MKKPSSYVRPLLVFALVSGLSACGGGSSSSNVALSGSITGLTSGSLTLSDGYSTVAIATNAASFTFPYRVNVGAAYNVTVQAQPADISCAVANGAGIAGSSDISNVQVTCAPNHTLGGTITGLTAGGLVLANGSDTVSPAANATTFAFPVKVGGGFAYGVTILTQPTGKTCTVQNGAGYMGTSDVVNVQVTCS
ncbi:hypothetical protein [Herbaspirillum sp. ST 5-3]|uniref:hypothetical protein n=1 Tax=Oxalobacteraceae TaxID=75682 RepID=UPI0010A4EB81|nr:hypothetical protein [Herbaspirillum sp. ST 5-3]